jgi:hypothetical protein
MTRRAIATIPGCVSKIGLDASRRLEGRHILERGTRRRHKLLPVPPVGRAEPCNRTVMNASLAHSAAAHAAE